MAAPPYGSGPPWASGGVPPPGIPLIGSLPTGIAPYVYNVSQQFIISGTAVSLPMQTIAAAGNGMVVIWQGSQNAPAIKDNYNSVWRLATSIIGSNGLLGIFYCAKLLGPNPTITATFGSSVGLALWALEIVGANPQFFLDCAASFTATVSPITAALRTSSPGDLIITAEGSTTASTNTLPAGFSTHLQLTQTVGYSRTTIGWSNTPVPLNTVGPAWTNTGGSSAIVATIAIRAFNQFPSNAQPPLPLPQFPPGVHSLPPGPPIIWPPFFPESPPSAPSTTAISGAGLSPSTAEAALAGVGALSAPGVSPSIGEGLLAGAGALAAPGAASSTGEANLAGSGALAALGAAPSSGEAFLPVPGMQIQGVAPSTGEASIGGSGALSADGAAPSAGSALIIGQAPIGALSASPSAGSASLQPQGLKAPGESASIGSAQLLGSGALAALGASASKGSAFIVGPLSALGASLSAAAALLLGQGALAAMGAAASIGSAAPTGTLAASGKGLAPSAGAANLQAIAAGTIFARGLSISSALATITGEVIFEIIPNGISPELPAIYQALRQFIQGVIGGSPAIEVILGLDNRVPMPAAPGFIVITAIGSYRLETNIDTDVDGMFLTPLQTGTMQSNQPTRLEIRIDLYGPDSSDWAIMLGTLFRDDYAVQALAPLCAPLYADEPRMLPLISAEAQYIEHWILLASVQYDPITVTGLGFATTLNIVPINVDEEFPP